MQALPIDRHLPAIKAAVEQHGRLVLVAPPGAGKTTRVAPALAAGSDSRRRWLVVQPRRIAALSAASRVAAEQASQLGEQVGYSVRFERRVSKQTRIEFLTDGLLLRRLQRDPFLSGVQGVLLDEFHERRLASDLCLALLQDVRRSVREDLALVVMSATLAAEPVARYLLDAPVLETEGRAHPVAVSYVPASGKADLPEQVHCALTEEWPTSQGHGLVFLPGMREIRLTAARLEPFAHEHLVQLKVLHGSLRLEQQQAVLQDSGTRKLILATNVAETSLTIDGVDLVVDSGLTRQLQHDTRHGLDRLMTVRHSRHSAEQRSGRAGRTGPGRAVRLWSEREHALRPLSDTAEIHRVDLSGTLLQLRAWGVTDPCSFPLFEMPPAANFDRANRLLEWLGAMDDQGRLTAAGRRMVEIPAHPRLARILVAGQETGQAREAALLCALLDERDVGQVAGQPSVSGPSDLLRRLDQLRGAPRAVNERVNRLARELERALPQDRSPASAGRPPGPLHKLLLPGYPDRLVRRRTPDSSRGRMVGGRGVVLQRDSSVKDADLFLALDVDQTATRPSSEAIVWAASAVERPWLDELFPGMLRTELTASWDEQAERAVGWRATCFADLPLDEPERTPPPLDQAVELLRAAVRRQADSLLDGDPAARQLRARVQWLRRECPQLELPALDREQVAEMLAVACEGLTSLSALRQLGLAGQLENSLHPRQRQQLRQLAPENLVLPTGRRAALMYALDQAPRLSARVQELFGLRETPRVAGGRVAVQLILLGPHQRPVQVTQDLTSFWQTTYAQVRKDLRGRYPKHSWPEDPLSASPESGPKRRRRLT